MRELRLEGYAGCRELVADGLSCWLLVDLTADGSTHRLVVRQLSRDLSQRASLVGDWLRVGEQNAQLSHPNLTPVVDWGMWRTQPCIAHEARAGVPLSHLLQLARMHRAELPVALAAHVAHSLLSGLAYASTSLSPDSVHFDVRPERVHVDPSGGVLLGEFGPWGLLEPAERTRLRLEAAEAHYLAPEVVQSRSCDVRGDLFSVGAIVFELVWGRRAFAGSTSLATAVEVSAGRRREVREASRAPDAFCTFVERLLAHQPEARYQSAAEALAALSEFARLLAQGQDDLRAYAATCSQASPALAPVVSVDSARPAPAARRGAAVGPTPCLVKRQHSVLQTVAMRAPRAPRGSAAPGASPPQLAPNTGGPAVLAGVVTQFLSRPLQSSVRPGQLAPPPVLAAVFPQQSDTPERDLRSEPLTLAPPPMSVRSGASPAVAAAFPSFGSFVRVSTPAAPPVLSVDHAHGLGAPSLQLPEFCEVLFSGAPPRHAASRPAYGARGEAWRDPSRTVFFAKVYARGKTIKQARKLPVLAVVALSMLFGSVLLGALYLLYRVLR